MLDEAFEHLGPRPKKHDVDEIRTYGHIVVDEAQDLSPMQLRMLTRRSLNGSMTVVGDIAQSTGAWAHDHWDEILEHLPDRREPRHRELTVGYRIPGPTMDLAARVLKVAAPQLDPPIAVRSDGDEPEIVQVAPGTLEARTIERAAEELAALDHGNVAVVCATSAYDEVVEAFEAAGVAVGRARRDGFTSPITVVPVSLVKGLEVDATVVMEPNRILREEQQGARSLYVAVTRSTKRLTMLHTEPLPDFLHEPDLPS